MRKDEFSEKDFQFWNNKRVLVTGGGGFLGKHLVKGLRLFNVKEIIVPDSKKDNLLILDNIKRLVKDIDIVVHLAARVGGIEYNQKYPGSIFYENLITGTHLMEEARLAKVKKFVAIGTICAYPKIVPIPFKEEQLWDGYPEETNAPYGLAKKMLLVQSQAYRVEYGFNSIYLLPVNLYGPGDNFDPKSSHVIPALIRKIEEARIKKKGTIQVWGTGTATREFLYVEDCARAILLASSRYSKPDPINLGVGFEVSISDLVQKIEKLCGYEGKILFDRTKPDGQPRRMLDTAKAYKEFGFKAKTRLDEGLKKEISWYRKQKFNLY